jgi:N-methylhydantoinase B/oxoprolinase/acetone carboxylase alpha subunit
LTPPATPLSEPTAEGLDPVQLTIINNAFVNICREMGVTMTRTAFSPIFNEGLDFSCAMFDRQGNMIGQAEYCPGQLAASIFIVRWTLDEIGLDSFEPGDVVLHNDPYRGGNHIPEHSVLRPVFYDGELWGFVANVGHLAEIGGKAVGSFAADATEIFQEGLRIPPVKIVSRDENVLDLWRLIMANHRTPRNTWGDLNAQIGSLRVAERRLIQLIDRYGPELLTRAGNELMDYSERWMRAEIAAIPDGTYEFTDYMENDGVVDEPVEFHLALTIDGEQMIADWTGSQPQVRGPINTTYAVTSGAVYNAIMHVADSNIPKNSGAYRSISVIAPPGSVVNVVYPGASVGGNTETHPKLFDMVMGALAPVLRDKVSAAQGASGCNFLFGGTHPKTHEFYANYHLEGCGWGAKDYDDGNDATIVVNGNCRNTPVEIFETRYPLETIEYSLITDSGGAGRQRGGLGTRRIMRIGAGAQITASALFDRTKGRFRAWGLEGGLPGGYGAILVKRRGDDTFRTFPEVFGTVSASKFTNVILEEGDEVLLDSPGGGGFGDPLDRARETVRRDVEEGLISPEAARSLYGWDEA